jgi:hypothetical protein
MNKALFVFVLVLALFVVPAMAAKPVTQINTGIGLQIMYPGYDSYKVNTNISLHFHVYNSTGTRLENASVLCMFHIYNKTNDRHLFKKFLVPDDTEHSVDINNTVTQNLGLYTYAVDCVGNTTVQKENGFTTGSFEITNDGNIKSSEPSSFLFAIILLPMLLGLFFLYGSSQLGEDHSVFKLFLWILSFPMFFISLNYALVTIIRFYNFTEIEELIGSTTWIIGLILGLMIVYFIVYSLIKFFAMLEQKKQEKRDY